MKNTLLPVSYWYGTAYKYQIILSDLQNLSNEINKVHERLIPLKLRIRFSISIRASLTR